MPQADRPAGVDQTVENPPRRISYYLLPKGFAEKAKLTMTFLSYNIHHYSRLKAMVGERFLEMAKGGDYGLYL